MLEFHNQTLVRDQKLDLEIDMKETISFIFNLLMVGIIISFVVTCYFKPSQDQDQKNQPKVSYNSAQGARPFNRDDPRWIKEPGYKEYFRNHQECIQNMQERTHNFLKSWYQEETQTENYWKIESYRSQGPRSDYWMEISCAGRTYTEALHELPVR